MAWSTRWHLILADLVMGDVRYDRNSVLFRTPPVAWIVGLDIPATRSQPSWGARHRTPVSICGPWNPCNDSLQGFRMDRTHPFGHILKKHEEHPSGGVASGVPTRRKKVCEFFRIAKRLLNQVERGRCASTRPSRSKSAGSTPVIQPVAVARESRSSPRVLLPAPGTFIPGNVRSSWKGIASILFTPKNVSSRI